MRSTIIMKLVQGITYSFSNTANFIKSKFNLKKTFSKMFSISLLQVDILAIFKNGPYLY